MYKKTLMLLSFIALLFIGAVSVRAEEYICEYEDDENNGLTIKYNDSTGVPTLDESDLTGFLANYYVSGGLKENYKLEDDNMLNGQLCPDSISFVLSKNKLSYFNLIVAVMPKSLEFCQTISKCEEKLMFVDKFYTLPYKSGGKGTFNNACVSVNTYESNFVNAIADYLNCQDDAACESKRISDVNSNENLLKNYCKNIVSSYTHADENEEKCMAECFKIDDVIKTSKINAGIEKYEESACGFSDKLLAFISNIMRWMKYILPAIVILLGIIDFIKAIASSKDDEMKKAQGRFIKRLIAAALVFIIPLIIEFVLDIMGFGYNSCDIF